MASDWLKVVKDTPDKPEIAIVARLLGIGHAEAFLNWFRLYAWADGITDNGKVPKVTLEDGDRLSHCTIGVCAAFAHQNVKWILPIAGDFSSGFYFSKWDRHNGKCSKARVLDTERNRRNRKKVSGSKPDKNRTRRDVTLRDVTDGSVRPFVTTDHFDLWPEARRRAAETAKKLWPSGRPKPESGPERIQREADNAMLVRFAFLGCAFFGDGWLADGIAGTIANHPKPIKNKIAYLKSILRKSAENQGHDLNELLDSVKIPERPKEAASVPSDPQ